MPIPFTLRQLEYFVAVAERGSVTAAAAARNVSQPSVSVAISELEAILGRALFMRQAGQRLAITPAGRRLLVEARTTLASASRIASFDHDSLENAEVSITSFRDLGSIYLPKLLTGLARHHPTLTYRLAEGDLAEVVAQIRDGRSEVAITYDIDLQRHGIARHVIDRLSPHVLLSVHHPLAMAERVNLESLVAERVIIENFPVTLDYFVQMFRKRRLDIKSIQLVPSFEMQRGLVANGWGVGLSCVRPEPDISYDGELLICRPIASQEPMQAVVVAHLGEETLSMPARRFIDLARTAMSRSF
ncbi:LysR family transcriptional regulator [Mesorhizobium sp. STM 4661]|uniref:LysR family transcriptional regulator n=1 Tax=Mesorhizobium sp. STM 4661 TaxID=1297570 RepID=UPI0002BD77F3|nr:LysR family transcriptional regulator [Mesorhizobium sp. STM 4661]CCV13730.1 Transcriptional regulator, LysR family [Mesorhizobium sp. STM 4661]